MWPFGLLARKIRGNVRYKLLALTALPVALVLPVALAGLTAWAALFTYKQLYIKANADLTIAHDIFERIQQDQLNKIARLGESYPFRSALATGDDATLGTLTAQLKTKGGFSFLRILPIDGERRTWRTRPLAGIQVLTARELAALDPVLATAPGPTDAPRYPDGVIEPRREQRGMLLRLRQPVIDPDGRLSAILDGGLLLNANHGFVAAIHDLVYRPGNLPPDSVGTVGVFLDDACIAAHAPQQAGPCAADRRVSEAIAHAVLDKGETRTDRTFVVDDWYISAYQPIVDVQGKRVGILHVGYLETPYRNALWQALGLMLLIILGLLGLYAILALRGAKSIFTPVEKMSQVVRATRHGRMLRVGQVQSQDELAELAHEFDNMLDRLERHATQMRQWTEQLEDRVDERTAELQRRNHALQRTIDVLRATRRKLVTAEKLAALGELTAGVAHEINNPTQVMLGNLDILIAELGDRLDPVRTEIDLVVEQVYRIQAIVEKLLQYARPGDYAGYLTEVDVNPVIHDTVALIQHLRNDRAFALVLRLEAQRAVAINRRELQQVLVNLLSNAVHALPDQGGEIVLASADWQELGVCISVSDNGCGMDADQCDHIFNPFYSTKREGEGSGLGLSVSYGLIRRYGGNITVSSTPGVGTCFSIWLRRQPEMSEDAETIAEQLHALEQHADPHEPAHPPGTGSSARQPR